jgi:hypothetical protein
MKNPIKVSIKESVFKTEPAFTKALANNPEWMSNLFDAISVTMDEDCTFVPEYPTRDGGRIDIVVKDVKGKVLYPIECMDATGKLNRDHATKIRWYQRDVGCTTGIVLCESADEYVQRHIREDNEKSDLDVWVLVYDINEYDVGNGIEHLINFNVLVSPLDFIDKRNTMMTAIDTSSSANKDEAKKKLINDLEPTGLFTDYAPEYATYRWGSTEKPNFDSSMELPYPKFVDVSFHPKPTGKSIIHFYHGGNLDTDEGYKNQMIALAKEMNYEVTDKFFRKLYTVFNFDSHKKGLEMYATLKAQGFKPMNA